MSRIQLLPTRGAALALVGALALAAPLVAGAADEYPSKPVRVVVGFAPGGPTDIVARLVAKHLSTDLGQPFVIENKAGAAGNIGTTEAARAAPDGYTALVAGINLTINPYMTDDLKVDSRKDLKPVKVVAITPTVLVVRNDFPASNLKEFIAEVRKNPGKYSSAAPGSSPMLATVLYNQLTQSHITPVPYKGAAPAMTDLIGGHVDLSFATLGSVLPHIKAGKVKALAVATLQRDPMLPEVGTFAESGMKDFRFDAWVGLVTPAKTPDDVVTKLSKSLDKLVGSKAYEEQLASAGLTPVKGSTPASYARIIDEELALYEKLAAKARGTTATAAAK
jgi:tripartite-type tricarboxylate transporter receptor subunit TctC